LKVFHSKRVSTEESDYGVPIGETRKIYKIPIGDASTSAAAAAAAGNRTVLLQRGSTGSAGLGESMMLGFFVKENVLGRVLLVFTMLVGLKLSICTIQ
jgi:hypothetical protein